MAAFGFGEVERQYVVVDAEQFGHLADQLVLHALGANSSACVSNCDSTS
ncbi:hypothetical protein RLIN73S_05947 [Rhodanobacter lindaniclasticus]